MDHHRRRDPRHETGQLVGRGFERSSHSVSAGRPRVNWPEPVDVIDDVGGSHGYRSPKSAAGAIKNAVWSVDRNLPLSQVQTLDHAIGNATWASRSSLLLVGIFSGVALILVVIGIYGVMSYEVAQRTHEIGIRMALGAGRGGIVKMVAHHSVPVALIGTVCGLGWRPRWCG